MSLIRAFQVIARTLPGYLSQQSGYLNQHCFLVVVTFFIATSVLSQSTFANDKMVDIDSGSVHALSMGEGKYTVIFEAGFGSNMIHWRKVAPAVSQHNKIFAYSRLGSGKSSKPEKARKLHEAIGDFEAVVAAEHLKPPFILVAHSFGAMILKGFAEKHPNDVAGIVLVDPYNPGFVKALKGIAPEETDAFLLAYQNMLPPYLKAGQAVLTAIEKTGAVPEYGPLPNVPVVVLTSMKQEYPQFIIHSEQGKRIWKELHSTWFNRFSSGRHEVTTLSGHNIALEAPEMVIDSIAYAIKQADKKARLGIKEKTLALAGEHVSNEEYDQGESVIVKWLDNSQMTTQQINSQGYVLLNNQQPRIAKWVLKFNVQQNPALANAYDSYGEALMALALYQQAKIQFETALALAKSQGKSKKALEVFLKNIAKVDSLLQ